MHMQQQSCKSVAHPPMLSESIKPLVNIHQESSKSQQLCSLVRVMPGPRPQKRSSHNETQIKHSCGRADLHSSRGAGI